MVGMVVMGIVLVLMILMLISLDALLHVMMDGMEVYFHVNVFVVQYVYHDMDVVV